MGKKFRINNVSFELTENHDFDWMNRFGNVFCVFDEQDSGNISFGVEKNGTKYFVKYAGAKTMNASVEPEVAVGNLKRSIQLYVGMRHPILVNLVDHFETDKGYALVFDWFEGEGLHPHWKFSPPLKYQHPDSPFYRFRQLPIKNRIESFNQIIEFHVLVEEKDFIAVDFYDGSILYDFVNNQSRICDIDLYQKKPFQNTMGRLWGSSRFMSPEEFQLGAEIDERTNVFRMGATAFCLLGGELDRSLEKWQASKELYDVAIKAVQEDKSKRFSTVKEFSERWKMALDSSD